MTSQPHPAPSGQPEIQEAMTAIADAKTQPCSTSPKNPAWNGCIVLSNKKADQIFAALLTAQEALAKQIAGHALTAGKLAEADRIALHWRGRALHWQDRFAERDRQLSALIDSRDAHREALQDLLSCRSEQQAIGGGPGWKEREAKAWRAAEELFEE